MERDYIISTLDTWFRDYQVKDYTANGLQFEGKSKITKIACAVDVSLETLLKAEQLEIDLLITHHGLIWGGMNKIVGLDKNRIEVLYRSQINLYCMHLPLDLHPELGNNQELISLLGMNNTQEVFFDVGYIGEYSKFLSYDEFKSRVSRLVSSNIIEMPFGSKEIKKVAVCSGGAGTNLNALFEAKEKGADTFFSGETNSILYHYAKELQMNVICAGHYATETLGVQATMNKIKQIHPEYSYQFIDFPTNF